MPGRQNQEPTKPRSYAKNQHGTQPPWRPRCARHASIAQEGTAHELPHDAAAMSLTNAGTTERHRHCAARLNHASLALIRLSGQQCHSVPDTFSFPFSFPTFSFPKKTVPDTFSFP